MPRKNFMLPDTLQGMREREGQQAQEQTPEDSGNKPSGFEAAQEATTPAPEEAAAPAAGDMLTSQTLGADGSALANDAEARIAALEQRTREAEAARVAAEVQQEEQGAIRMQREARKAARRTVHTVVPGNTLSGIADQYLNDASRWPEIYEANKDVIGNNPNLILVGQELTIPGA